MLQELSLVEQRYLAVREVLDGAKVTDVATRYGVDRRTVHRWLVRYTTEGLGALADRSSQQATRRRRDSPGSPSRSRSGRPGRSPEASGCGAARRGEPDRGRPNVSGAAL